MAAAFKDLTQNDCRLSLLLAYCVVAVWGQATAIGAEPRALLETAPTPQSETDRIEASQTLNGPRLPVLPETQVPPTPADVPHFPLAVWSELIEELFAEFVPDKHVEARHWGKQSKRFDGLDVKWHGIDTQISRRTKTVNHGFWQRYTLELRKAPAIAADQKPDLVLPIDDQQPQPGRPLIKLQLKEFQPPRLVAAEPSDAAPRFELFAQARVRVTADYALWTYGVKGLNGNVEADVTVQLRLRFELKVAAESDEFALLQIRLAPRIIDLDLKVTDIDTRKIGVIGGTVAKELGNGSRKAVEDLLQSREGKLIEKLQRKIDKQRDKLSLSPLDLLQH